MHSFGSEFDPERIEYSSQLTGNSFNRSVWDRKYILVVNNDNSLEFEDENLNLEATCDSY